MSNNTFITNRKLLRLSATLLFAGILLSFLAGIYHPDSAPANDHIASFTEYAHNDSWTAVHLGQFAGMAVLITGLLVLFLSLDLRSGTAGWAGQAGFVSAVIALGLYAVLQAVDGVALKQTVDAWVNAPETEKAARFASAETIRWLEWAVRSYQSFVLGLSFLLFGTAIVWTARIPRPIGILMGLSGLAYMAQGWVLGSVGFSETNTIPTLLSIAFTLTWSVWFLVIAWRMKESIEFTGSRREFAHN
jgi:hypothetical protein